MQLRSEPRLAKQVVVRVFGMDSAGRPTNQSARTLDISKHGVRVAGVNGWSRPGEIVGIRYGAEKARYRIVWIGEAGTSREGEIGLVCADSGRYIWDVPPPIPAARSTSSALRQSVHGGGWKPTFTDSELRRKHRRFSVQGSASVRDVGNSMPQWANVLNLSLGGCYLETAAPLPIDRLVELTMQVGEVRINAKGVVIVRHPLVGMGIHFCEMSAQNWDKIRHLIGQLEQAESPAVNARRVR